jgi:hypothetical protein
LRSALDKAFGYRTYAEDRVDPAEVDDLTSRRQELAHIEKFAAYRDRLRIVARYTQASLPDLPELRSICTQLEKIRTSFKQVSDYIGNETRLVNELLEPAEDAIQSYKTRYLQIYDKVSANAEEVRQHLELVDQTPAYAVLGQLAQIAQLGGDGRAPVQALAAATLDAPARLFPTTLSRSEIERLLKEWPQPPGCQLTFDNGEEWLQRANRERQKIDELLRLSLLEKAKLLHSDALRTRLAQAKDEPLLAPLLSAQSPEAIADYLQGTLNGAGKTPEAEQIVELLKRYLRKLQVRRLNLASFQPGKRTLEAGDVEQIVSEFRAFLNAAMQGNGDELTIVELEVGD